MGPVNRVRIDELRQQAGGLDYGPAKVTLLEEVVRLADLMSDAELGYDSRNELIYAAVFSGFPEKAMVAFSWNLAQFDRQVVDRPELNLLWKYKYVIDYIIAFPQISRDMIVAALADFGRRIEQAGLGMRSLHKLSYLIARLMDGLDESVYSYECWRRSPRDELSDCATCDLNTEIEYIADAGRDDEAVARAGPILAGRMSCRFVPHVTLAKLLLPLVRLGRLPEAVRHHQRGYRMVARNPYHLEQVAQHIEFLTLTDNLSRGVKLFETHLPWALGTFNLFERFHFMLAASFLFDRLQASGKTSLKLRLPATFSEFRAKGPYQINHLASWIDSDAADLARRFDARNGTGVFTRRIQANRTLEALVTPFSLKPSGEKDAGNV